MQLQSRLRANSDAPVGASIRWNLEVRLAVTSWNGCGGGGDRVDRGGGDGCGGDRGDGGRGDRVGGMFFLVLCGSKVVLNMNKVAYADDFSSVICAPIMFFWPRLDAVIMLFPSGGWIGAFAIFTAT
jgi:hypothetical protein